MAWLQIPQNHERLAQFQSKYPHLDSARIVGTNVNYHLYSAIGGFANILPFIAEEEKLEYVVEGELKKSFLGQMFDFNLARQLVRAFSTDYIALTSRRIVIISRSTTGYDTTAISYGAVQRTTCQKGLSGMLTLQIITSAGATRFVSESPELQWLADMISTH